MSIFKRTRGDQDCTRTTMSYIECTNSLEKYNMLFRRIFSYNVTSNMRVCYIFSLCMYKSCSFPVPLQTLSLPPSEIPDSINSPFPYTTTLSTRRWSALTSALTSCKPSVSSVGPPDDPGRPTGQTDRPHGPTISSSEGVIQFISYLLHM